MLLDDVDEGEKTLNSHFSLPPIFKEMISRWKFVKRKQKATIGEATLIDHWVFTLKDESRICDIPVGKVNEMYVKEGFGRHWWERDVCQALDHDSEALSHFICPPKPRKRVLLQMSSLLMRSFNKLVQGHTISEGEDWILKSRSAWPQTP